MIRKQSKIIFWRKKPMADITKEDVIEFIANMSVLELSELVKEMEEKFGVSAAAPVAMMAAGPAGDAGGAAAEEKNEFDVVLCRRRQENRRHQGGPRHYRSGPQRS
jgi:ribosomal protein L7/L12